MTGAIYMIRNRLNGNVYIGSTGLPPARRWYFHQMALRKQRHHSSALQNAFNKYGEAVFEFIVIEIVSLDSMLAREQFYLDSKKPEYNIAVSVERSRLGLKSSPEHCARMSAALKGRVSPMKGKKFTAQHRKRISDSHKDPAKRGGRGSGWHHTQESRQRLSIIAKARGYRPPKDREAYRAKISARAKRWHASLTPQQKRLHFDRCAASQRKPARITACVICGSSISYQPNGKYIPKTCGSVCLTECRRRNLAERSLRDPEANRKASLKRWAGVRKSIGAKAPESR